MNQPDDPGVRQVYQVRSPNPMIGITPVFLALLIFSFGIIIGFMFAQVIQ